MGRLGEALWREGGANLERMAGVLRAVAATAFSGLLLAGCSTPSWPSPNEVETMIRLADDGAGDFVLHYDSCTDSWSCPRPCQARVDADHGLVALGPRIYDAHSGWEYALQAEERWTKSRTGALPCGLGGVHLDSGTDGRYVGNVGGQSFEVSLDAQHRFKSFVSGEHRWTVRRESVDLTLPDAAPYPAELDTLPAERQRPGDLDANWVSVTGNLCIRPEWLTLRIVKEDAEVYTSPWAKTHGAWFSWTDGDMNGCVSPGDVYCFALADGETLQVIDNSVGWPVLPHVQRDASGFAFVLLMLGLLVAASRRRGGMDWPPEP